MQRFVSAKSILETNSNGMLEEVESVGSLKSSHKLNEEGGWTCRQCTFQNQLEDQLCQMCNSSRPISTTHGIISCPLCTYENSLGSVECLMCGSGLEEMKEKQQNTSFLPSSSRTSTLRKNEIIEPERQSSTLSKRASSVSVSLVRRSSTKSNNTASKDPYDIDDEFSDGEDRFKRKVGAETTRSGVNQERRPQREDEGESEEEVSDEEIDSNEYSEDGTYSQDSDDDEEEDGSDSSDEESEEDESDEDDAEVLVDTPPRRVKKTSNSPIIINDDIDEFESSSDVSLSEFFSTKTGTSPSTTTLNRSVESFLSNKPREARPSLPEVSAHYWSVKYLMRKGVCAINFDEFTLDKGATNPNSNSLLSSGKKRKKLKSVDEIYAERREKRGGKRKRGNIAMMKRLQNGSLVAPTKTKGEKGEPKKRRKTRKRKGTGDDSTGAVKPKRSKSRSSSKKIVKVKASSDGWIAANTPR